MDIATRITQVLRGWVIRRKNQREMRAEKDRRRTLYGRAIHATFVARYAADSGKLPVEYTQTPGILVIIGVVIAFFGIMLWILVHVWNY